MKDALDAQETQELGEPPGRTAKGSRHRRWPEGSRGSAGQARERPLGRDAAGVHEHRRARFLRSGPGDRPVFTHWGAVAPWVLERRAQFRPPPPPALTSSAYAKAINEVRVARAGPTRSTRTEDQTQIARFWAAPIQNYWNEIAQTAALAHHRGPRGRRVDVRRRSTWPGATPRSPSMTPSTPTDCGGRSAPSARPTAMATTRPSPIRRGRRSPTTPADPSYPGAHSVVSGAADEILSGRLWRALRLRGDLRGAARRDTVVPVLRRRGERGRPAAASTQACTRAWMTFPGAGSGPTWRASSCATPWGLVGPDPARPVRRHRRGHRGCGRR